jgi:hypothetical protein
LFGSYSPYYDQAFELARMRSADFDDPTSLLVEGGNVRAPFGLPPLSPPSMP